MLDAVAASNARAYAQPAHLTTWCQPQTSLDSSRLPTAAASMEWTRARVIRVDRRCCSGLGPEAAQY
jgi:hypothetical protein